ncbi:DNA/RNA non-specific endonuclease [Deinococcus yavapaiensis]|uniref:Endonuclease n=1 Tax=Deinococcus yavapaiensis KR-236 TaxID=694435 RepID=A0A318S9G8_9DEIO|nr:DNA/RNA non-specific endonuclease [Deinococcus yavapaiensis]PYE52857.1 endonuclease G [Deinococcus yavapaiensis KR-236]
MNQRRTSALSALLVVVLVLLWRAFFPTAAPNGGGGGGGTGGGSQSGVCGDKFAFGQPSATGEGDNARFLCRQGYATLHDPDLKVPLYVAEHLKEGDANGAVPRNDDFEPDPDLSSGERAELTDYRGSGFDRGHMAPAADFSDDATEMQQSFYLSNMVPQNGVMNQGIWAGLESAVRSCAKRVGDLYVITGPLFDGPRRTIGESRVAVPSGLYKIVIDRQDNKARAFVMPNRALRNTSDFSKYEADVAGIERETGLDFAPNGELPSDRDLCRDAFGG